MPTRVSVRGGSQRGRACARLRWRRDGRPGSGPRRAACGVRRDDCARTLGFHRQDGWSRIAEAAGRRTWIATWDRPETARRLDLVGRRQPACVCRITGPQERHICRTHGRHRPTFPSRHGGWLEPGFLSRRTSDRVQPRTPRQRQPLWYDAVGSESERKPGTPPRRVA